MLAFAALNSVSSSAFLFISLLYEQWIPFIKNFYTHFSHIWEDP